MKTIPKLAAFIFSIDLDFQYILYNLAKISVKKIEIYIHLWTCSFFELNISFVGRIAERTFIGNQGHSKRILAQKLILSCDRLSPKEMSL